MTIHVYERKKVQAEGWCQPTQESTTEQKCVRIRLMVRGQVVIVQDPDFEDGEVGANTHITDSKETDQLQPSVAVIVSPSLDK